MGKITANVLMLPPLSSRAERCPTGVSRATRLALAAALTCATLMGPVAARAEAMDREAPGGGRSFGAAHVDNKALQIQLSDIAKGRGGFVIDGMDPTDTVGAVAPAGDVNGDGLEDIIIGAPGGNPHGLTGAGKAYVVFGKAGTARIVLSDVAAGVGGFVINGRSASEYAGFKVSAAGDVNGDGLGDVLVHERGNYGNDFRVPRDYVIFGKTDTVPVELSAVDQGQGGFVISGFAESAYYNNVSAVGDVNGDGLADMVVETASSTYYREGGAAYVVFGKTDTKPVNVAALGDGGFLISADFPYAGVGIGNVVAGVGDVNGDGFADILLGTSYEYQGGWMFGYGFVVFGKSDSQTISLRNLHGGVGGFEIDGTSFTDGAGASVGAVGDVNGDGLADLIIGAPGSGPNGSAYVVFGKTDTQRVSLAQVAAGTGGFVLNGAPGEGAGWQVSGAGDVNSDGLGDIAVDNFVVFGKPDTTPVNLADVRKQIGGVAVAGAGTGLTVAGDVNGDGLSDLVIADSGAGTGGRTYVIFGGIKGAFKKGTEVNQMGTSGDDTLNGTGGSDVIIGGAGNDLINGRGDGDILNGGSGDDVLVIGLATVHALASPYGCCGNNHLLSRMDGGTGSDTLQFSGTGITMDMGLIANQGASLPASVSRLESIERVDLTGTGNNTLILGVRDVQDITGMNRINSATQAGLGWTNGTFAFPAKNRRHQLVVDGNAGDVLELRKAASGWVNAGTVFHGGIQYTVYDSGTAGKLFERVEVIVVNDVTTIVDTP